MSDDRRKPTTVQIGEHDYARAPRIAWPGEVVLGVGDAQRVVPGTWQLEFAPRALVRAGAGDALPATTDAHEWTARLTQIMTLQEPGVQLRLGAMHDGTWHTLEVTVPTRPPTLVEFDRAALTQLTEHTAVALRVLA